MYVLLEGVVPMEMALILYYCIEVKKYFSLRWLHGKLESFPYTYLEKRNQPETIPKAHYLHDLKIKQTSAAMLTLNSIMPCVFPNLIAEGDTKWELVLLHLHITHIIISLITSDNIRHELDHLVSVLHQEFWQEYPEAFVTPKCTICYILTNNWKGMAQGVSSGVCGLKGNMLSLLK